MKEFMLIFLGADYGEINLSPEETQQQMQKWFAWVDKLKAEDIYVEGRALTPAAKSLAGNAPVATDGPYAESKELVGGYFVVKAESIDAAAKLAEDYPDYHLGGAVEVREVMVFES